MKVSELISHLQTMNPDSTVVVADMYYDVQEGWTDNVTTEDIVEKDDVVYLFDTDRIQYMTFNKGN